MPDPSSEQSLVPTLEADLELDCRSLRCPLPVITLARRHTDVAVGAVITVTCEDRAAATDIPAWCRLRRQEFLGADVAADGVARYWVRRTH